MIIYNNKVIKGVNYGGKDIHKVYAGDKLVWADSGGLYTWGRNTYGQLGHGGTTNRDVPTRVGSSDGWKFVTVSKTNDANVGHTFAINTLGELYACGNNTHGQLGIGGTTSKSELIRVGVANDWINASCGKIHSAAINSSGELYTWGYNNHGQLGHGDTTGRDVPTRVGSAVNWIAVQCSDSYYEVGGDYCPFSLALNSLGEIYSWGRNTYGQLGHGGTTNRDVPTRVGVSSDWIHIGCGRSHSLAINSSGELYTWGSNNYRQLGLEDTANRDVPTRVGSLSNWVYASGGESYSAALNSSGELYTWGYNSRGEMGLSNQTYYPVTKVGTSTNWITLRIGNRFTGAINTSGELYVCGENGSGCLGLGDTTNRYTLTRVGDGNNWMSIAPGYFSVAGIKY